LEGIGGEQGESQRRGDGMHSTRTSTALFMIPHKVVTNNGYDTFIHQKRGKY